MQNTRLLGRQKHLALILWAGLGIACHSPPQASGLQPNQAKKGVGPELGKSPLPRPACTKAGTSGEKVISIEGDSSPLIVSLPEGYDGRSDWPLAFAFHGYTRTHQDCRDSDCRGVQAELGRTHVVAYLKSISLGWEQPPVLEKNLALFQKALEEMSADYCVDGAQTLVSGTSSGATFSNLLACRFPERISAVAPVSGSMPEADRCRARAQAIVIHGIDDPHVPKSAGEAARDRYAALYSCTPPAQPTLAEAEAKVRAARTRGEAAFVCADYQGCQRPLRYCLHSEGGYDGSTHGWPEVGGRLIADFLAGRP